MSCVNSFCAVGIYIGWRHISISLSLNTLKIYTKYNIASPLYLDILYEVDVVEVVLTVHYVRYHFHANKSW